MMRDRRSMRCRECRRRAPKAVLSRSEQSVDVAPDLFVDQCFDAVHRRGWTRSPQPPPTKGGGELLLPGSRQSAASFVLRRSVISIDPGACVMQNSGFTAAIAACGVTPQAQNTGSSSGPIGTASP